MKDFDKSIVISKRGRYGCGRGESGEAVTAWPSTAITTHQGYIQRARLSKVARNLTHKHRFQQMDIRLTLSQIDVLGFTSLQSVPLAMNLLVFSAQQKCLSKSGKCSQTFGEGWYYIVRMISRQPVNLTKCTSI